MEKNKKISTILQLELIFTCFFSAERLRAKSGKTMVGRVVAGPRNFLLKRGLSANAVEQKDCSPGFA
jgi:hypothetical protein